ncbi:hypothetical protein Sste5346_010298 [Sporothrix stenoceras]|uniref:TauD/TfdA-like domain-containing protein n=1 Tax=Sporothrix stenoceras TaxID=5173 RepID=A0ABR3YG71_9PEZI
MPSAVDQLGIVPLHASFCAEVRGVDFSQPVPLHVIAQVQAALDKHGVLVFRKTGVVNDRVQIEFAAQFGPLDGMEPHIKAGRKMRLPDKEMFDYLDAQAAYDDLPTATEIKIHNLVGNHSMMHNRKLAAPDIYEAINPIDVAFSKHKLVVPHRNGRNTLYITSYIHNINGWDNINENDDIGNDAAAAELMNELFAHADQPKYTYLMPWKNDTDLIMWDNTAALNRATGEQYLTKHARDMRRTTSHDVGKHGMGLNAEPFRQGLPIAKS